MMRVNALSAQVYSERRIPDLMYTEIIICCIYLHYVTIKVIKNVYINVPLV